MRPLEAVLRRIDERLAQLDAELERLRAARAGVAPEYPAPPNIATNAA